MVRVGVGKHEKRGNGEEETAGTGIAWPPGWDAPPPALHPDHPSAPLPQVTAQGSVTPLFRSHRPSHEHDPRARRAPGPRHAAGRGGRRLYAVPDQAPDAEIPFGEPYAAGLSDPARPHGGLAPAGVEGPGQRLRAPGFAQDRAVTAAHEAWAEAAAFRRAAEREAAAILQRAAQEALAIRRAAERDAADLRSAAMTTSAEPGQLAAYVTEYVGKHALAEQWPQTQPAAAPVEQEALASPARPSPHRPVKPRPRSRSAAATKPAPRQAAAMRKMVVAFATLIPVTLVSRHRRYGQHTTSRKPGPWIP